MNSDAYGLLRKARIGDGDAFATLCARVLPKLLPHAKDLCTQYNIPRDHAHDIVQEALLRLVEKKFEFESWDALIGWLFVVATNKTKDLGRRLSAAKRGGGLRRALIDIGELSKSTPKPFTAGELKDILQQLPLDKREVVEGFLRSETFSEIASRLGLHVGTVRRRFQSALEQLRRLMA